MIRPLLEGDTREARRCATKKRQELLEMQSIVCMLVR